MSGPACRSWEGGRHSGLQVSSPVCSAVGPCALEYTKMKTVDVVQRHRIHSSHLRQDSPSKWPALCVSGVGGRAVGGTWEQGTG